MSLSNSAKNALAPLGVGAVDIFEGIFGTVEIVVPLGAGTADAGTWTAAQTSGCLFSLTRSANTSAQSHWTPIPVANSLLKGQGFSPTGMTVNYSVNSSDADDVRFELWKVVQGADGAAPTAAVVFGEADADYDEAHNTAAERGDSTGAPELHLATVTDAGTPITLGESEELWLRSYVDATGGGGAVVAVNSVILKGKIDA